MAVDELLVMYSPYVAGGFLLGCIPLLAGLGIHAVIIILKKI